MGLASTGRSINFVIRNVKLDDINQVIKINRISLPENYPYYFFEEHIKNYQPAFFVAEVDGEVVGYVMPRLEWGMSFFKGISPVKKGHLVSIAVLPEYRNMGIGSALLSHFLDAMRNYYDADEAYLEVRVSNYVAIRLYEKFGFRKVKVLHYYYADGEDAYLMAEPLK